MDPKERKRLSLQKLDHMLTGSTYTIPEKKQAPFKFGIIGNFVSLAIGTAITLGYVAPTISDYISKSDLPGNGNETVKTVLGIIPLMIAVVTLLTVVAMLGPSKEDDDGSKTKEAEVIGKIKRDIRGKTYPV